MEAEVAVQGVFGKARAMVPSGASTGQFEALELRDGGPDYGGLGVLKAVGHVNQIIAPALLGVCVLEQAQVDQIMLSLDASPDKSKLGANAMLAVSMAVSRAAAKTQNLPLFHYLHQAFFKERTLSLPRPMINLLNGGLHADNNLDIQEFLLIPDAERYDFQTMIKVSVEVFQALKQLLKTSKLSTNVGDEGGFAPHLTSHQEALKILVQAIEKAGYRPGEEVHLGLDCAATEFFQPDPVPRYRLQDLGALSPADWLATLDSWAREYPLISIEDVCAEEDWASWRLATQTLGGRLQLVGDDLFVTQTNRLSRGIAEKVANAILIKPNQVGTLSETIATMHLAQEAGYEVIISHRSGETEDTFIADLSVASAAGQIKTGSLSRTDRVAKYNRLLRIAEQLA